MTQPAISKLTVENVGAAPGMVYLWLSDDRCVSLEREEALNLARAILDAAVKR